MRSLLPCLAAAAMLSAARAAAVDLYPLRIPFVPSPATAEVEGKLEFLDAERVESSNPRQFPQARLRLHLSLDLTPSVRLVNDLTGTPGRTPRDPRAAGADDSDH